MIRRPEPDEHAEYYGRYIQQVPDGDLVRTLAEQVEETAALLAGVPAEAETFAYAPGKWSFREVVGHVIDVERLFAFRCLHAARGDPAPLPGMEQEDWARVSNAASRPLERLVDELRAVRGATVTLVEGLDDVALDRRGVASGVRFTVRAFPWIIAGHELHHQRIVREVYLPALEGSA